MAERIDDDADLSGDYARDTHQGAFGDDYAREKPVADEDAGDQRDEVEIGKASE